MGNKILFALRVNECVLLVRREIVMCKGVRFCGSLFLCRSCILVPNLFNHISINFKVC